jgi:hypothetical protein
MQLADDDEELGDVPALPPPQCVQIKKMLLRLLEAQEVRLSTQGPPACLLGTLAAVLPSCQVLPQLLALTAADLHQ